jgi:hypothetical protein
VSLIRWLLAEIRYDLAVFRADVRDAITWSLARDDDTPDRP